MLFARKFCLEFGKYPSVLEKGCFLGPQDFSTEWSKWLLLFCDCYFCPTPKIEFIDSRGRCKTNLASVLFFKRVSADVVAKEFLRAKVDGTVHLCKPPGIKEFGLREDIPFFDTRLIHEVKKMKLFRNYCIEQAQQGKI